MVESSHLNLAFFRVDAALHIGTGHVMRCLTLAYALRDAGIECRFICREHAGNLIDHIRGCGFEVHGLGLRETGAGTSTNTACHATWLGDSWEHDAAETLSILSNAHARYLIVDHYALAAEWEDAVKLAVHRLFVIDDLADRRHNCDLLLDQNLGRNASDYSALVPRSCRTLTGPRYALLRKEFAEKRRESLSRRVSPVLTQLLISMGGVDQHNVTGDILRALQECPLPAICKIAVVLGPHAPWLENVRELAASMPWDTDVKVGVSDMENLMTISDLSIGAAGSTSWERCCLGLPTLMFVLAENQREAAYFLEQVGAVWKISEHGNFKDEMAACIKRIVEDAGALAGMAEKASLVCDGGGVARVLQLLD